MAIFLTPEKIITGIGSLSAIGDEVKSMDCRSPVLVTGKNWAKKTGCLDKMRKLLAGVDNLTIFDSVPPEPSCGTVDALRETLKSENSDLVIALGGGSVMDVGKAGAILSGSDKPTSWHLIEQKLPISNALPIIAIPTTSGTGSEATVASVLTAEDGTLKQSFKSPLMLPKIAILDPELTISCPPSLTAHSGMDALTQAIESFCSKYANSLTDALAEKAMKLIAGNLTTVYGDGTNIIAREAVAEGSLLAGMALANAKLGLVHGIAHPIGGKYHLPHGLVCAILLPAVLEFNREVLGEKYETIGKIFGQDPVAFCRNLLSDLEIPQDFKDFDIGEKDLPIIIERTLTSGSTKANPRDVTAIEVKMLVEKII